MANCIKCGDTGVLSTGTKKIPCSCIYGDKALFHVTGIDGLVSGIQVKKHFLTNSPEPIYLDPNIQINADLINSYVGANTPRSPSTKSVGEIVLSPKYSIREGHDREGNLAISFVIDGHPIRLQNDLLGNAVKFVYNGPNSGGRS